MWTWAGSRRGGLCTGRRRRRRQRCSNRAPTKLLVHLKNDLRTLTWHPRLESGRDCLLCYIRYEDGMRLVHSSPATVGRAGLVFHCRTISASTAPCTPRRMCCPTHCAGYCISCQSLVREFSGWIWSPPPSPTVGRCPCTQHPAILHYYQENSILDYHQENQRPKAHC